MHYKSATNALDFCFVRFKKHRNSRKLYLLVLEVMHKFSIMFLNVVVILSHLAILCSGLSLNVFKEKFDVNAANSPVQGAYKPIKNCIEGQASAFTIETTHVSTVFTEILDFQPNLKYVTATIKTTELRSTPVYLTSTVSVLAKPSLVTVRKTHYTTIYRDQQQVYTDIAFRTKTATVVDEACHCVYETAHETNYITSYTTAIATSTSYTGVTQQLFITTAATHTLTKTTTVHIPVATTVEKIFDIVKTLTTSEIEKVFRTVYKPQFVTSTVIDCNKGLFGYSWN